MDTIFVVTTMTIPDVDAKKFFDNKSRTVGWFPNFRDAKVSVVNNDLDICEAGSNNFCVIEECSPGFYNCDQKEHWFKWNEVNNKYESCDKPNCYHTVINFGLG